MPCKQQSDILTVYQSQFFAKLHNLLGIIWKAMIIKGMNAMPALSKFLVLLALFLLASHSNAFTSLSSVAGNQVGVNHLTQLHQPMSDPTNEPSREPIREPTKRLGKDALLPGNLSSKRVLFRVSMMDDEIQSCKTHSEYTKSYQVAIPVSFVSFRSKSFGLAYIVGFILIGRQLPTCSTHSILSSLLASKEVSYLPVFSALHSTVRLQVPEWHVGFALLR
jgi:hypothetical protein